VCGRCGYAYYGKPVSRQAARGRKRHYAYYRCVGTDAYRFGGKRVCQNKQVRTNLLEAAVWGDVCVLLKDPGRLEAEYQRRLSNKNSEKGPGGGQQLESLIQQVKRGSARLIDAYGEGLLEKSEFEPRVRDFRERLARLETEAKEQADLEAQERELRMVIGRLQEFAARVEAGLEGASWSTRREIIRTLVKRVEVDEGEVRVIYRVSPSPFVESPQGGSLPDCRRGAGPSPLPNRYRIASARRPPPRTVQGLQEGSRRMLPPRLVLFCKLSHG
jgi:site-specific DNA recombinase